MENIWKPGKIVGKGVKDAEEDPKSLEGLGMYMQDKLHEGMERLPGELEKTEEEKYIIKKINQILEEKCKVHGVAKPDILLENIHILPQPEDGSTIGRYSPDTHTIVISRLIGKRLQEYFILLEEMTHAISYTAVSLSEDKRVNHYRLGYGVESIEDDLSHEHFNALNEAVTAKTFLSIIKSNEAIIKDLNITEEELKNNRFITYPYLKVLDLLLIKISEYRKEKIEETEKRFEKGMLTGDMMHLRDVDKVFGRGSLRFLAALGSAVKPKYNEVQETEFALEFFNADNKMTKDSIAKKLLNERERLQYEKLTKDL